MGIVIFIIQELNHNCCRFKDEDNFIKYNLCDPNYNNLIKQNYRINEKRVYKFSSNNDDIKCPLCKYNLPIEEETIIRNMINSNSEGRIFQIINNYNRLIKDVYEVNIFDRLEEYSYKLDENINKINDNRYYQHSCKRKNFKEIIIDICSSSEEYNFKSEIYQPYLYEKWGNNQNEKQKLLRDREIAYNEQLRCDNLNRIYEEKQKRKEELKSIYLDQFDEKCFDDERSEYERAKRFIDNEFEEYNNKVKRIEEDLQKEKEEHDREIERKRENNEIDENYQDSFDYDKKLEERKNEIDHFESICKKAIDYADYYGTKFKINKYFEETTERNVYVVCERSDWEWDKFWDYINSRSSEYCSIKEYLKNHQYPNVNKYRLDF